MDIFKTIPGYSIPIHLMKYLQLTLPIILLVFMQNLGFAQPEGREPLYFPDASVEAQMDEAKTLAREEGKHILVQIGGNWCVWCYRFHDFLEGDSSLSEMLNTEYVSVHLNYSQENMNEDWLAKWGYPQRFGFPVFVVLDAEGQRLHTQNSAYLESDKSYDSKAVKAFFQHWTTKALLPESYE